MDWQFTQLGRNFFENTLPSLVRALSRIAEELKRYNDNMEKEKE